MKILFFILLIAIGLSLNAQYLIPKKDFNTCLYGYVDQDEKWIISPQFNEANYFEGYYALVQFDGKYGLIKQDGKFALNAEYQQIRPITLTKSGIQFFIVTMANHDALLDSNLRLITEEKIIKIVHLNYSTFFKYSTEDDYSTFGILDSTGQIITDEIFTNEDFYIFQLKNKSVAQYLEKSGFGLYDLNQNKPLLPTEYLSFTIHSERLLVATKYSKKPQNGNETTKLIHILFDENIKKYIDFELDSVIFPSYYDSNSNEEYAAKKVLIKKDNRYAWFNYQKNIKDLKWYDSQPMLIENDRYICEINQKLGVFNSSNSIILKADYEQIKSFERYYLACKKGKWAFFDKNGQPFTKFQYSDVEFSDTSKIIYVRKDDKLLLFNTLTREEIPIKKENLEYIEGSQQIISRINLNGKFGYINEEFKTIQPFNFIQLPNKYNEENRLEIFEDSEGKGLINNKLEIISAHRYNAIIAVKKTPSYKTIYFTYKNNKWGILDEFGSEILAPIMEVPYIEGDWHYNTTDCDITVCDNILFGFEGIPQSVFSFQHGLINPENAQIIYPSTQFPYYIFHDKNENFGIFDSFGSIVLEPIGKTKPIILGKDSFLIQLDHQFYIKSNHNNGALQTVDKLQIEEIIWDKFMQNELAINFELSDSINQAVKIKFLILALAIRYELIDYGSILDNILIQIANNQFDIDYCKIDYCIRESIEKYNLDYGCWPPGYGTFDETAFDVEEITQNYYQFRTNHFTYGHGHGDVSEFQFFRLKDENLIEFKLSESYKNPSQFYSEITQYILDNAIELDILNKIDCKSDENLIDGTTPISISNEGLIIYLNYWDSGEFQQEILINWKEVNHLFKLGSFLFQISTEAD